MFVIHNKPYMTVCRCLRNSVRCVGVHVDVFKERRASNGIDMRICIIHRCSNILACLLRTTQLGPILRDRRGARQKIAGSAFFFAEAQNLQAGNRNAVLIPESDWSKVPKPDWLIWSSGAGAGLGAE